MTAEGIGYRLKSSYRNRVARLKGDAKSTDSDNRTRFGDARHKERL